MTSRTGETPPARPGFPAEGSRSPVDQHHEDVPRGPLELSFGGALRERSAYGKAGADRDQLWSMLAYLGMVLLLPALIAYLVKRRQSPFVRYHAAQALNLWITAAGYTLSCVILGGLLALDTTGTGLAVGIPLACLVWVSAIAYGVTAGLSARRGRQRELPRWICSPMVR